MKFDFEKRQKEKQLSRDRDAEDLKSGKKTAEQLWQENNIFSNFVHAPIKISAIPKRAR